MNVVDISEQNHILLVDLGEKCGDVSLQCSDIAGFLNQLNGNIQGDVGRLGTVQAIMRDLSQNQMESGDAAQQLLATAQSAEQALALCNENATVSLDQVAALVRLVTGMETQLRAFLSIIEAVGGISDELRAIAKRTRMLGLNAAIEAARGGEATKGFAVVADEIRYLAEQADESAGSVSDKLSGLDRTARALIGGVEANIEHGRSTGVHIDALRTSMAEVAGLVDAFRSRSIAIADCTDDAGQDVEKLRSSLHQFSESAIANAGQLENARVRVDDLEGFANDIFNTVAHAGIETRNSRFIDMGISGAAEIRRLIGRALAEGRLSVADLFDTEYLPVAGTDPTQYTNRFVGFADAHIRPVLDVHTAGHPAIIGCCLVDINGFLPTHITERSRPHRAGERQWNLENGRNRQIFMDSQTRRALDSEGDFFLYAYRQDLGDGRYRALRSIFVPLEFSGRRWGLYELGYLI